MNGDPGFQVLTGEELMLETSPVACDECGAPADTVHVVPWVTEAERAVYACPKHDPGGYWFPVDKTGLPKARDMLHHIAEKTGGPVAVVKLMERYAAEAARSRREFAVVLAEHRAKK